MYDIGPVLTTTLTNGKLDYLDAGNEQRFEAWVYHLEHILKAIAPFVHVLQLLVASSRLDYIEILLPHFVKKSCITLAPTVEQPDIRSRAEAILYPVG